MMSSLRREITISRVSTSAPDIRICNLDVGFFASGDSKKTTPGQAEVASEMPDLPSHIWPIYVRAIDKERSRLTLLLVSGIVPSSDQH